tara:strand:- start:940 stop:1068 length:129 start_codon:yes stop_codon:yes gene_type:complete
MFGEFSIEFGIITFAITFVILMALTITDSGDAERMFSRRDKR